MLRPTRVNVKRTDALHLAGKHFRHEDSGAEHLAVLIIDGCAVLYKNRDGIREGETETLKMFMASMSGMIPDMISYGSQNAPEVTVSDATTAHFSKVYEGTTFQPT